MVHQNGSHGSYRDRQEVAAIPPFALLPHELEEGFVDEGTRLKCMPRGLPLHKAVSSLVQLVVDHLEERFGSFLVFSEPVE